MVMAAVAEYGFTVAIGSRRETSGHKPASGPGRVRGMTRSSRLSRAGFTEGHGAAHSGLILAARITLPHFSVSSTMSLPKSAVSLQKACRQAPALGGMHNV